MNWPAEVAPRLAAEFQVDAALVEIVLELEVRAQLSRMTAAALRGRSAA